MIELLRPGLIYVADEAQFAPSLERIADIHDGEIVASKISDANRSGAASFASLLSNTDDRAVDAAFAQVRPNTIARFLFTSGSTGAPKAVINTHGMLTANQEAKAVTWPFMNAEPPVIADWLPWSHRENALYCNFDVSLR